MWGFPWRGRAPVRSCPGPTNGPRAPRRLKRSGPPRTGNWDGTLRYKKHQKTRGNPHGRFKSHWSPPKHHLCSWSIIDFPIMNSLVPVLKNSNMARTRPSRIWWWKLGRGCHLAASRAILCIWSEVFQVPTFFFLFLCEVFQVFQVSQVSYVRDWCYIPIFNSPGLHFYHVQGRMWRCPESWLWRSPRSVLSLGSQAFHTFGGGTCLRGYDLLVRFTSEMDGLLGVAGMMTLLVMKWIIPENSLRLAPVRWSEHVQNPPCHFPTSSFWRWWEKPPGFSYFAAFVSGHGVEPISTGTSWLIFLGAILGGCSPFSVPFI